MGFIILCIGLFFLPFLFFGLIWNIFIFETVISLLVLPLAILMLVNSINASTNATDKILDQKSNRQRTFGIASLVLGAAGILASIAFTIAFHFCFGVGEGVHPFWSP